MSEIKEQDKHELESLLMATRGAAHAVRENLLILKDALHILSYPQNEAAFSSVIQNVSAIAAIIDELARRRIEENHTQTCEGHRGLH